MEQIFNKLDFDNPLLDGFIGFTLITLFQYIESIYDDKKSVGAMWCFAAAIAPWIIPYFYELNLSLFD